jgi:anthranilate phosphoribosyltransferase
MNVVMHEVVDTLLRGDRPVRVEMWDSFWDCLDEGTGPERRERAVSLLEALNARAPDKFSVGALIDSLESRREHPLAQDAVNIVGTGGGPSTFNISTAAALVAGTLGVRIIKSGSRAYTSRYGSIDVLELLGVPLTDSHEATAEALEQFGIAFTGLFVYPSELTLLARNILPLEMRKLGRFFNCIGPFLAALPTSCQVTGVADHSVLPLLEHLAANHCHRQVWLCFNRIGVDELVSFEENVIRLSGGDELRLMPDRLALATGSLRDLRQAGDRDGVIRQLTALLDGEGPPAAVESICLNAAALVVASGLASDWADAFRLAARAIARGHPAALLGRMRQHGVRRSGAHCRPGGATWAYPCALEPTSRG